MTTTPSTMAPPAELSISQESLTQQGIDLVDPTPFIADLCEHFGFAEDLFDDYFFVRANHKLIRIITAPFDLPPSPQIDRAGLDFLRIDMIVPRLTTAAAMAWAHHAVQNVVDTTAEQCERYLSRAPIRLSDEQMKCCTDRGSVFIRHLDFGLGVGFLESTRPEDETFARVRSLYPKAFAVDLDGTSAFGNPA